jgi:hypothetical protein
MSSGGFVLTPRGLSFPKVDPDDVFDDRDAGSRMIFEEGSDDSFWWGQIKDRMP